METQFGARLATHRGSPLAASVLAYVGVLFWIGAGAQLLEAHAEQGVLLAALGTCLWWIPLLRWRQSLEVFEHGFVWHRLWGTLRIADREVMGAELIDHQGRIGYYQEVAVTLVDGRALSIKGLMGADQVRNLLLAWTQQAARSTLTQPPSVSVGWQPPHARP